MKLRAPREEREQARIHLRQNFERSFPLYQEEARVQKKMAQSLAEGLRPLLAERAVSVLEIGVGTGLLTRALLEHVKPRFYLAVDLVFTCKYFLRDLPVSFVVADAEEPSFLKGRFEVIVSNATFQWFRDPWQAVKAYHALLPPGGILALSTFGPATMREVRKVALPGLQPLSSWQEVRREWFEPVRETCWQERLFFPSPLEVLRHIRHTGARGHLSLRGTSFRRKDFWKGYERLKTPQGYPLTYEPIILVWRKP